METSWNIYRELLSEQTGNTFNMFETTKISLTVAPFKSVKANLDIQKKTQISEHLWQSAIDPAIETTNTLDNQLPQKVEMWQTPLRSETWSDEDDEENIHMRYMLWLSWSKLKGIYIYIPYIYIYIWSIPNKKLNLYR